MNKRMQWMLLGITAVCGSGCIDLAVNDGRHKHRMVSQQQTPHGQVYTMRGGLGGVFSRGMNRLEDELVNDYGIHAQSTVWYKGYALSQTIIRDYKAHTISQPIILVGHSLGANEQINVATTLQRAGAIPVDLLITVDAVLPFTVPSNVKHVLNIYTPSWVPLFSGLSLRAKNAECTRVENVNVQNVASVNHFTIDANDEVQRMMLAAIERTFAAQDDTNVGRSR